MQTTTEIIKAVTTYYNVSYNQILEKHSQGYPLSAAKNAIIYLFRYNGELKCVDIADTFNVTLRSVLYRLQRARREIRAKTRFSKDLKEIEKLINTK